MVQPEAPVRASLNQGKVPADTTTIRASYEQAPEDDEPAPPVEEQEPSPADAPLTLRTDPSVAPGKPASMTAAVVGDTIITGRELRAAILRQMNMKPSELSQLPREQLKEFAEGTLDNLIKRTLILQQARREVKPEQWNTFTGIVEKAWNEKELPALQRKWTAEDMVALRKKMEEAGDSLDDSKDGWKMEQMSREFLMMRVQPKVVKPNLPEMEAYYAKHRGEPGFHRDARVTWREIVVSTTGPADIAAARTKAADLRQKLAAGGDFAKLAKAESAGVTAAKGGAWETDPNGSAVPAINRALATLAPGQISAPIEGPKGIHIVRVESRRNEGIAPFVEVQREVAEAIFQQSYSDAIEAYLGRLKAKTTIFLPPNFDAGSTSGKVASDKAKVDGQANRASARR